MEKGCDSGSAFDLAVLARGSQSDGPAFGAFALAIGGAEVADFVGVGRERAGPEGDGLRFHIAASVSGVGDDGEKSAWAQPLQGYLHGGEGGVCLGDASFVVPRQPAEVEHDGGQPAGGFGREPRSELVVAGVDQGAGGQGIGGGKSVTGAGDGFGLNVEGKDSSCGCHEPCQEEGVMSIACRGIDYPVAGIHPRFDQGVGKINGGGQGMRVGSGHWSTVSEPACRAMFLVREASFADGVSDRRDLTSKIVCCSGGKCEELNVLESV